MSEEEEGWNQGPCKHSCVPAPLASARTPGRAELGGGECPVGWGLKWEVSKTQLRQGGVGTETNGCLILAQTWSRGWGGGSRQGCGSAGLSSILVAVRSCSRKVGQRVSGKRPQQRLEKKVFESSSQRCSIQIFTKGTPYFKVFCGLIVSRKVLRIALFR